MNNVCFRSDHLQHIVFPNLVDNSVRILLGVDAFWHIAEREILKGPATSPYGVLNLLGGTITGPLHQKSLDEQCNWKLEKSGTPSIATKVPFSSKMKQSIQHDGVRCRIILLWKNNITMTNNYGVAKAQHESLQWRLQKDEQTMQLYDQSLLTDIDKGYVKLVTFLHPPLLRIWYLPNHPIINPQKSGWVGRVTNATSKLKGISLNSCFETGQDLLSNINGLLMRLRAKSIEVSGDIEGMFMQIGVKEDVQHVLRFLWRTNQGVKQYQYTRLVFGAKCSPAIIIFALHQTAVEFCNKEPNIQ